MLSRILPSTKHHYSIERVRFGVPLDQVCCIHNDIPGPLLILVLKLNKEAPFKKDVFRAPGHQANMKKLIHFLQTGRLVNIDNYSVYTIASVLKKFLRKLPGGIFGHQIESKLFDIIQWDSVEEKRNEIHRLITSLPPVNQHLLVLLFGTFRAIASSSERAVTGMTSEALGVSVAPSFFQSCVSDGSKVAKMEDVQRFKVATTVMKFLIDNFGISNLFGRDNYEYYARISGRVLKVEENWIFAFKYPPDCLVPRKTSLEIEKEWLQCEAKRWGLNLPSNKQLQAISSAEECQSTPTLCPSTSGITSGFAIKSCSGPNSGHHIGSTLTDEAYARLSMSLEENVYKLSSSPPQHTQLTIAAGSPLKSSQQQYHQPTHPHHHLNQSPQQMIDENTGEPLNLDELKMVNRYAESTKSLSFLPMVHERQTQRMKTRSEWFLNPSGDVAPTTPEMSPKQGTNQPTPNGNKVLIRRTSSKEKRLARRSSSKKDKENGNQPNPSGAGGGVSSSSSGSGGDILAGGNEYGQNPMGSSAPSAGIQPSASGTNISESDCTELDVQQFNITLTYKPRI